MVRKISLLKYKLRAHGKMILKIFKCIGPVIAIFPQQYMENTMKYRNNIISFKLSFEFKSIVRREILFYISDPYKLSALFISSMPSD